MSREITRKVMSLGLILALIVMPLGAIGNLLFTSHALQAGTQVDVYPTKVVVGQDILFTVVQRSGAFTPGAPIYIEFSNSDAWVGDGAYWLGLKPGQSTIPAGSTIYITHDLTGAVTGSDSLTEGSAWVLFSDSKDGSSGVVGPEVAVEDWGGDYPIISPYKIYWASFYEPSDIISVSYSDSAAPTFTVVSTSVKTASPGDTIYINYYNLPGKTVKFYWDYYGGQLLATEDGGSGVTTVTIPDAPEGFHAIVAVTDEGYGAFTWIYVEPSLVPNKFSIQGKIGEKVTFTGKGFPANAQLDTNADVILHVYDGSNSADLHATIVSGGTVDAKGNVQFTIELKDTLPPSMSGGLVDVEVPYASGDVDLVTGSFGPGELAPAGDGTDLIKSVMAISTPDAYGDEFMVVIGPSGVEAPGALGGYEVGDWIKVGVVDFPARAKVDIYFGPVVAGTLTTDENGAAVGFIKVPTLPGFDNDGTQISYMLKAVAVDPDTHGYLVGLGVGGTYTAEIDPTLDIWWTPGGYGTYPYGDYLLSGVHEIHVYLTGLSPFAKVDIQEYYDTLLFSGYINVAYYSSIYNVVTLTGSKSLYYFVADANGVLHIKYTVSYAEFLVYWWTGDEIYVEVSAQTVTGNSLISDYESYYLINPYEEGDVVDVVSSPAAITPELEHEYGMPVVHPGDYIEIEFYSYIPYEKFKVKLDGQDVTMYNTENKKVTYVKSDSGGDVTVRIQLPNSPSIVGLHLVELVLYSGPGAGQTAAMFNLIVSSPNADVYGSPTVYVTPTTASPGDTIYIIGVNFEDGEEVLAGFSTLTVGSADADAHGAVVFTFNVPYVPAGTYAVYVTRTVPYFTAATTIEVVPEASVSANSVLDILYKAYGDTVTIEATGLEPNKAYMVYWSPTYDDLGKPLTDTGIPGVGTPLTWFTDSDGQLEVEFTVPFGVIGEDYYASIVPADDPTHRVLDPVEIIMIPASGFDLVDEPYVIVGQTFTVTVSSSTLAAHNNMGFTDHDWLNFLASEATITAKLSLPDGSVDIVPVSAVNVDDDYLQLTFKMPNLNFTGDVGIAYTFSYALYNSTSGNITYSDTFTLNFGGIRVLQGGGILLANVEDGIATLLDQNGMMLQKLEELEPVITEIHDGVAEIQTTLGTVTADLEMLSEMLDNATVQILAKGDEIIATIDTSAGQINATLQALMDLMEQTLGTLNTTQGLAGVLADMNTKLTNLANAVSALSGSVGQVQASLSDVQNSLGSLSDTVSAMQTTLNNVQSGVADANSKLDSLADTVNSVSSDVSSVKSDLADVKNSLTTINSNVGDVKSSVSDVSSKVDTLSDNVNSLAGKTTIVLVLDVIVLILALVIIALVFRKQG